MEAYFLGGGKVLALCRWTARHLFGLGSVGDLELVGERIRKTNLCIIVQVNYAYVIMREGI
jgi:hypothetical protein